MFSEMYFFFFADLVFDYFFPFYLFTYLFGFTGALVSNVLESL